MTATYADLLVRSCLIVLLAGKLAAQMTVTGALSGTVMDPSGQVIPAATVTLVSEKTNGIHATSTSVSGVFNFVAIQPETYSLKIEHPGFKVAERTGIVITANERVALGDIQLQVGAVSETISVEAQTTQVQTDSSEHSAVLTSNQLENLTARGRDVVSMLRTIPGVAYQSDQDSVGGTYTPCRNRSLRITP